MMMQIVGDSIKAMEAERTFHRHMLPAANSSKNGRFEIHIDEAVAGSNAKLVLTAANTSVAHPLKVRQPQGKQRKEAKKN